MKDLFFYSNLCEYSKNLLINIQKRNCRDMFYFVCVDQTNVRIPSQIDRVPAILTKTSNVLFDDDVLKYIETFCHMNQRENKTENPEILKKDDVAPFSISSDMNNYTDNFTFLDENAADHRLMGFGYISQPNPNVVSLTPQSNDSEKKAKLDDAYEKYVADRDADIKKLINSTKRSI